MADVFVKFTSEKVSQIRWKPSPYQGLQQSDLFLTGSWDNSVNSVAVWRIPSTKRQDGVNGHRSETRHGGFDLKLTPEEDVEPELLTSQSHVGDVTDLKIASHQLVVAASSTGSVQAYQMIGDNDLELKPGQKWEGIHYTNINSCPCTCLSVSGSDVATCGEDGRINVLRIDHRNPVRILDEADSCSMNAITHVKTHEVITVNSAGQLKLWDVRQDGSSPVRIFLVSGEKVPLHCVDRHPTQPHLVAAGGHNGNVSFWDMRKEHLPVTLFDSHDSHVLGVRFHPSNPSHLFTCSEDGAVLHWQTKKNTGAGTPRSGTPVKGLSSTSTRNLINATSAADATMSWTLDESASNIDISHVLPANRMAVNCLDIESNRLICGTDGEAIYLVRNIAIY